MKRDWDLIRQILLGLEETSGGQLMSSDVAGWDGKTVSYHLYLLNEAGLIRAKCIATGIGFDCVGLSLTWSGHELLDSIRAVSVWNRVKGVAREKGLELSFDAVKEVAKVVLMAMIKGG